MMATPEFKPPNDAKRQDAAGKGHIKSLTAPARFCTAPVTLPPLPWEAEINAEKEGEA